MKTNVTEMGLRKMSCLLILMPKLEARYGTRLRFALYMLQVMKVRRSGKVMEKAMPKVINIDLTIEALAVQRLNFEFWGGF